MTWSWNVSDGGSAQRAQTHRLSRAGFSMRRRLRQMSFRSREDQLRAFSFTLLLLFSQSKASFYLPTWKMILFMLILK